MEKEEDGEEEGFEEHEEEKALSTVTRAPSPRGVG